MIIRFGITFIKSNGLRVLMNADAIFLSNKEAEDNLKENLQRNPFSMAWMANQHPETFRVDPIECYDNGYPKGFNPELIVNGS